MFAVAPSERNLGNPGVKFHLNESSNVVPMEMKFDRSFLE